MVRRFHAIHIWYGWSERTAVARGAGKVAARVGSKNV